MFASVDCVCVCAVCVFRHVLTSSRASLAALAPLSAGHVQQAHVRHLDSGSSLSYQLPGSLSQLSPSLCIPLLHTNRRNSVTRAGECYDIQRTKIMKRETPHLS